MQQFPLTMWHRERSLSSKHVRNIHERILIVFIFGLIFQHSMALEQAFSSGCWMEPNLALESSPHQDNHEVNINVKLPTSHIINILFVIDSITSSNLIDIE